MTEDLILTKQWNKNNRQVHISIEIKKLIHMIA